MTVESLACPSCGSTQVKEVKAGTFFCDHCESVFKHVDPTQVTVAPAFCSCGNQITRQCNVCRVGLCIKCEALSPDESWGILIGVTGYGYRLSRGNAHARWSTLQHSSVVPMDPGSDWTSLVMSARKLYGVLEAPELVNHVCWDCLAAGVPSLAEAIEKGTICEDPYCPKPALAQCKCCQRQYCSEGLVGDTELGAVLVADRPVNWSETVGIPVDWPPGICWACAQEGAVRMADVIRHEFALLEEPEGYVEVALLGRPDKYLIPRIPLYRWTHALRDPSGPRNESRGERRRYRDERDNYLASLPSALSETERLADQLRTRWEREQFAHPCARSTWLSHQPFNHPRYRFESWSYVTADEGGARTALPGLTARS